MFLDSADRIATKAAKTGMVAVYVINSRIVSAGFDSSAYNKTLKYTLSKLLGIYNSSCPQSWIEDDLHWAQTNFNGE